MTDEAKRLFIADRAVAMAVVIMTRRDDLTISKAVLINARHRVGMNQDVLPLVRRVREQVRKYAAEGVQFRFQCREHVQYRGRRCGERPYNQ